VTFPFGRKSDKRLHPKCAPGFVPLRSKPPWGLLAQRALLDTHFRRNGNSHSFSMGLTLNDESTTNPRQNLHSKKGMRSFFLEKTH
jgi:hypothetical protein